MLQTVASVLTSRLSAAVFTIPGARHWVQVGYVLAGTAAVALPLGFASGFLKVRPVGDLRTVVKGSAIALLVPGFSEEVSSCIFPITSYTECSPQRPLTCCELQPFRI